MNDSNRISYSVTNESVTVVHNGHPTVVKRSAANFSQLRAALIDERWDDAIAHLRTDTSLTAWAKGRFTVVGNTFMYDGTPIPSDLNNRITEMATTGEDPEPLFKFWERLTRNPSHRSVDQLWRFLALTGIPLTSDGYFLAYKGVRMDFLDCHSGKIDNHPGRVAQVRRNQVSDDPRTPCHFGLHVGSLEYASSFGQRVVICKVDPANVVCVPYDCESQKMRVCEYEVVGLHGGGHMPSTTISDEDWVDESSTSLLLDDDSWMNDYDGDSDDGQVKRMSDIIEEGPKESDVEPKAFFLNEEHELPTPPVSKLHKKARVKIPLLDAWTDDELINATMDELRRHASKELRIVNAYRIPGGKLGLIEAIIKARS